MNELPYIYQVGGVFGLLLMVVGGAIGSFICGAILFGFKRVEKNFQEKQNSIEKKLTKVETDGQNTAKDVNSAVTSVRLSCQQAQAAVSDKFVDKQEYHSHIQREEKSKEKLDKTITNIHKDINDIKELLAKIVTKLDL